MEERGQGRNFHSSLAICKQFCPGAHNTPRSIDSDDAHRLSPERGNVAFASTQMGWCFTLRTFASMYADTFGSFDVDDFAARLWGNIYFDSESRKFTRKSSDSTTNRSYPRSFVHFILEPLYKLYTQVSGSCSCHEVFLMGQSIQDELR